MCSRWGRSWPQAENQRNIGMGLSNPDNSATDYDIESGFALFESSLLSLQYRVFCQGDIRYDVNELI